MASSIASCINFKDPQSPLDVRPVAGRIGAEIRNLRLSGQLDAATASAINAALVRHKVLFFRDQQHLTDGEQEAFAALLGEPLRHPTVPPPDGSRYLLAVDAKEGHTASLWHTDITFVAAYPKLSVLRALVIPELGGDTLWANTAAGSESLPEAMRSLVDRLWAVHSNGHDYAGQAPARGRDGRPTQRESFVSTVFESEHPVVHVHPETGERNLILGGYLKRFIGFSDAETQRLLAILQDYVTRPENTVRWTWRVGDVAIWDNLATQHRAVADFGSQPRVLRRATVQATVPRSIDGQQSRQTRPELSPPDQADAA